MPTFKTTENIVTGTGEYFDENWMDSDTLVLPEREYWDYQRELKIEDINIWKVIAEPWGIGVYAAWDPYAEFYLIRYDKVLAILSNERPEVADVVIKDINDALRAMKNNDLDKIITKIRSGGLS